MTTFTTMLAFTIIETIVRSWATIKVRSSQCRLHLLAKSFGNLCRLHALARHARDRHARLHQHLVVAAYFLGEDAPHFPERVEPNADGETVVEPSRLEVVDREGGHDEQNPVVPRKRRVVI